MMRYSMVVLAVALAAACGGDAPPEEDAAAASEAGTPGIQDERPSPTDPEPSATVPEVGPAGEHVVRVRVGEQGLSVAPDTVAAAGQVTFVMENGGDANYQLHVQKASGGQWKSLAVPPGGSIEMSMVLGSGDYTVAAPPASGGEPAEGMRRPLVVR